MLFRSEDNKQANPLAKVASTEHMVVNSQVFSFVQNSLTIEKNRCIGHPHRSQLDDANRLLPSEWDASEKPQCFLKAKGTIVTLCIDWRCSLQKRLLSFIPEVLSP